MNIIELSNESGLVYYGMGKDRARFIHHLEAFAALVAEQERKACLKIISEYQIPVGNSSAGEIACEMTYGALKDIYDDITARGTT
jgi:hypothetical protein